MHEALTPIDVPHSAFPMLNSEKVRMLSHTVLESRAQYHQGGALPDNENFRKILNDCVDSLYDSSDIAVIQAARGIDCAHFEFQRFFVRTGAVQIPGQEPLVWERAGRLVAMLEVLPRRYPDRVPVGQRDAVARVLPQVPELRRATISELTRAFADLLGWQHFVQTRSYAAFCVLGLPLLGNDKTEDQRGSRRATLIMSFLKAQPVLDDYLVFSVEQVLGFLEKLNSPGYASAARGRLEAFLRLAARSADELRGMLPSPEFSQGHPGKRLSPLERFPVVRIDLLAPEQPRFVVPNYRYLAKSFGAIVDFTLTEHLGVKYEAARGALFHLYLRQLIEERLDDVLVIPETRYDQSKGGKDSPDLTLVEPVARRIIGLEVKGRRINLVTRLTLGDDELAENLEDAFAALVKLPGKIEDLRSDRPEFEEWRPAITATGDSPPILVVVLQEGPRLLSHLLHDQAHLDPDHPLARLANPYCILTADDLERAVEIAHRSGRPLSDLLEDHYRRSGTQDPTQPPAEMFGDSTIIPPADTFAASFLESSD